MHRDDPGSAREGSGQAFRRFGGGVIAVLGLVQADAGVEMGFLDAMTRPGRWDAVQTQPVGRVEAARGEWEPLQVVLTGTPEELRPLTLALEGPVNAEGAKLPPGALFRGDFVRVLRSTEYAPLPPGEYVDPLVPIPDGKPLISQPVANDGKAVGEQLNQPVWIDFRIPGEAKPGLYRGAVVLRGAGGQEVARSAFEVTVRDFKLPGMPSLKSSIGMDPERVAVIHGLEKGSEPFNRMCRRYEDLLADHLLSPETFWGSTEVYDAAHGTASLDREGLPGLGTPREIYRHFFEEKHLRNGSIAFWPEWPLGDAFGKDRETALAMLAQLMKQFDQQGWADRIAVNCGAVDEPDSREKYDEVRRHGAFFHELGQRCGVRLPMWLTEPPVPDSWWWGTLHGAVDIWVPHVSDVWEDLEGRKTRQIEARLRKGEEVWMYPAMVQAPDGWLKQHGKPKTLTGGNPPAWLLDFPPMNYRIFAWAAPLCGITGILYWDTVEWRKGIDPWQRADTYEQEGQPYNGDGLLIYPGYRGSVGFEGPLPCVRLKWIREAMEDHAYFRLLEEMGKGEWARQQIRRVCRGMGDWDASPEAMFQVRRDLAARLEANSK